MQFFLDTADIDDIKKYASWGIVDGVTTNPSLIAKEGVSLEKRIKEIAKVIRGPISSEVVSNELEEMLKQGRAYAKWANNIYVKVPMTATGLQAVKIFNKEGIKTNVTLIFSASQALLAAKAGATLVSPFIGRLDDISENGMSLIADIVQIFRNYQLKTKVLVASIRHPRHVIEAAKLGADIGTMPPSVLEQLVHHPLTDAGIKKFMDDWEKVKDKQ